MSEQQDRILEELFEYVLLEQNVGGKMGGWQGRMGNQAWTGIMRDPQEDPKTL